MRLRDFTAGAAVVALLLSGSTAAFADKDDDSPADALRAAVTGQVAAYDKKDLTAAMSFVDTASPDYDSTKAAIAEQFEGPAVSVQVADFKYIGHDDEFAVARVKLKSTAKPDSGFVDNTVDSIMIFHFQDGAWKIWTEKVLGVDAGSAGN
jgi:hypothetical protein